MQRNMKMYGPMNALNVDDGSSCWYSDGEEGATQSLTINFGRSVTPKEIRIQFQAGFSAETCEIHYACNINDSSAANAACSAGWELVEEVETSDTHELQTFPLHPAKDAATAMANGKIITTDAMKIVFHDFTDFYGRVTVYRLGVYGTDSTGTPTETIGASSEKKDG